MTMSLKCSILGCRWGETEVEREREEDGSEVVVTIRETATCERCGEVRVVSENKEVTTMETAADIVADDLEEGDSEPAGTDAVTDETGGTHPDERPPASADTASGGTPHEAEPAASADESGAAIPDAESEEPVTATGTDDVASTGTGDVGSTGTPPAEHEDDAIILDDDEGEGEIDHRTGEATVENEAERKPGEWPAEPDDDGGEEPTEPVVEEDPSGFSTIGSATTVSEGEFYCPECGYATEVEDSSLREGDYCPECHRGSLEHRAEEE